MKKVLIEKLEDFYQFNNCFVKVVSTTKDKSQQTVLFAVIDKLCRVTSCGYYGQYFGIPNAYNTTTDKPLDLLILRLHKNLDITVEKIRELEYESKI